MKAIQKRLPSWKQVILLFIAASFSVNLWAIINFLRVLPSFLFRLRWGEIMLVASYTQAFALLESIVVLTIVLFLGFLLPVTLMRDHWVVKGTILIWLTSIWAASYHFFPNIIPAWKKLIDLFFKLTKIPVSEERQLVIGLIAFVILWVGLYFLLILILYRRLRRGGRLKDFIGQVLERIRVLATLYVIMDVIGLLTVIVHFLI